MPYFAQIDSENTVINVIIAEQDFIKSGAVGDPKSWVETSFDTRGNTHYSSQGIADGGTALRGNYAVIGSKYDAINDVFLPKKPFDSWILDSATFTWQPPIPKPLPLDDFGNSWDEASRSWVRNTANYTKKIPLNL